MVTGERAAFFYYKWRELADMAEENMVWAIRNRASQAELDQLSQDIVTLRQQSWAWEDKAREAGIILQPA